MQEKEDEDRTQTSQRRLDFRMRTAYSNQTPNFKVSFLCGLNARKHETILHHRDIISDTKDGVGYEGFRNAGKVRQRMISCSKSARTAAGKDKVGATLDCRNPRPDKDR